MDPDDNTGGAIDTTDTAPATDESAGLNTGSPPSADNSGAIPVDSGPQAPADNSGAAPVSAPQQQPQQQTPGFLGANSPMMNAIKNAPSNLMKLLAGEGAVSPQNLDVIAQKADPQGQMTPADRQVVAIHQASQTQGDDAAAAILQANRVAYGTKAAFAYTALQGTQGKPADLNAAIKAANQAQENLPDGSNVIFSPGGQGQVVAVASLPGSKKTIQFNLSTQQFASFLDVGKDGQFDKMMDVSAPGMLQKLTQANAAAGQQGQGQTQAAPQQSRGYAGPTPDEINSVKQQDSDRAAGVKPGMSDEDVKDKRDKYNQENEWERQALKRFPWASQGDLRGQYVSNQRDEAQKQANAIDVAGEKGKNAIKVAEATGRGRVDAATVTSENKLKGWQYASDAKRQIATDNLQKAIVAEQGKNARSALANQMGMLKKKIETGASLSDEENALAKKYGAAADQAMTPHQQPQQQGSQQEPAQHSGKDAQAMAWAKANPTDPRAVQIMQRLNGAQ